MDSDPHTSLLSLVHPCLDAPTTTCTAIGQNLRLALGGPHAPPGSLVVINTQAWQRYLMGRRILASGEAANGFVLSGLFTDQAKVSGPDALHLIGLFQQAVAPRWRWSMLEGCEEPEAIAARLLAGSPARDSVWRTYERSVLVRRITAHEAEAGPLPFHELMRRLERDAMEPEHAALATLMAACSALMAALPPGFELPILGTLQKGGSVYAFLDAIAPGYELVTGVLMHAIAPAMRPSAVAQAQSALRTADVVVLTGFGNPKSSEQH